MKVRTKRRSQGKSKGSGQLKIYDTLESAAAGLELSVACLKDAKRRGCPAFVHSRVHADKLLEWLKANPDPSGVTDKDSAQIAVLVQQERRLRIANDLKEESTVSKNVVREVHARILSQFRDAVYAKVVNELPVYTANQPVNEVRRLNQTCADELIRILGRIGVDEWGNL